MYFQLFLHWSDWSECSTHVIPGHPRIPVSFSTRLHTLVDPRSLASDLDLICGWSHPYFFGRPSQRYQVRCTTTCAFSQGIRTGGGLVITCHPRALAPSWRGPAPRRHRDWLPHRLRRPPQYDWSGPAATRAQLPWLLRLLLLLPCYLILSKMRKRFLSVFESVGCSGCLAPFTLAPSHKHAFLQSTFPRRKIWNSLPSCGRHHLGLRVVRSPSWILSLQQLLESCSGFLINPFFHSLSHLLQSCQRVILCYLSW